MSESLQASWKVLLLISCRHNDTNRQFDSGFNGTRFRQFLNLGHNQLPTDVFHTNVATRTRPMAGSMKPFDTGKTARCSAPLVREACLRVGHYRFSSPPGEVQLLPSVPVASSARREE